jgi:hypothetical protein
VLEEIGSQDSVWIVAETGFVKKDLHWAGVKRQYSGAAGRIKNSQVGVSLCYAGGGSSWLLDEELCLPGEWVEDGECAGVLRGGDAAGGSEPGANGGDREPAAEDESGYGPERGDGECVMEGPANERGAVKQRVSKLAS